MERFYRFQRMFWWCLLLVGTAVWRADCQELDIQPSGRQVKTVGSGIIFTCSLLDVTGSLDHVIMWRSPRGEFITATRGRVYVEKEAKNSLRLYVTQITEEDSGPYQCETELPSGPLVSQSILALFEPIKFEDTPVRLAVKKGSKVLLPCKATGQPAPEITWRFKRKGIPNDPTRPKGSEKYMYERGGLRVYNVEEKDAGIYQCRAEVTSQGNLKLRYVTLEVLYPPRITVAPKTMQAIKGEDVTLHCEAKGSPAVTYEWFKEQKVTDAIKLKVRLGKDPNKTSHYIEDIAEDGEGRYFCLAINDLGTEEVYADIKLMIPPEIQSIPQKIHVEGDVMTMTCKSTGVPTPDLTWNKVGHNHLVFREGEQMWDPRITMDNTEEGVSKLIISGVLKPDTGTFTCSAKNPAGHDTKNGTLVVQYEPTLVTEGTEDWAWPKQTRTFNCTATGLPQPDITWFRYSQYLRNNDTYSITGRKGSSTLQVRVKQGQKWVYGSYSCMAKNRRGYKTTNFYLHEAKPPAMPRNVTVSEESSSTVTLEVVDPQSTQNLPITSWMVRYTEYAEPTPERTFFFGNGEMMRITGLKPNTAYTFFLSARNAVGFGRAVKFRVRTPPRSLSKTKDPDQKTQPNHQGGNETSLQTKDQKDFTIVKKSTGSKESHPFGLTIAITFTVIIIALLAIIIFLVYRRRSKREGMHFGVRTVLKKPEQERNSKDIDMMQLNLPRKESPVPSAAHRYQGQDVRKVGNGEVVANGHAMPPPVPPHHPKSPELNQRPTSDVPTINCVSTNPNSLQRQAWNQMLQRKDIDPQDEEVGEQRELNPNSNQFMESPSNELPPPPPFLLDNGEIDFSFDPSSYNDILDGYHSGDNIDDVLDQEDDINITENPQYYLENDMNITDNPHNHYGGYT